MKEGGSLETRGERIEIDAPSPSDGSPEEADVSNSKLKAANYDG